MAQLQGLSISNGSVRLKLPVGTTAQREAATTGRYRYNSSLTNQEYADGAQYQQTDLPDEYRFRRPDGSFAPGLAGKFFNGNWRTSIPGITDGNIGGYGAIPFSTANQSSNITSSVIGGLAYGVNRWTSINWTTSQGDSYGGIWIGYFIPPATGTWTFITASDDGSGCWVGELAKGSPGNRTTANSTLNNGLGDGQGRTERSGSTTLTAGLWYPIRIVWEELSGGDSMTFWYQGPGVGRTTNLANHFRCRMGGNPGTNANFNQQVYGDF